MLKYIAKLEYLPDGDDPGVGFLRTIYDDGSMSEYQCTREVAEEFAKALQKKD